MRSAEFLDLTGRAVDSGLRCYEHLRAYERGNPEQLAAQRSEKRRQQLRKQIRALLDDDVVRRVSALVKRVQGVIGDKNVDMARWLTNLIELKENGQRSAQQDMGLSRNAVLMSAQEVRDILTVRRKLDAMVETLAGFDEKSEQEYVGILSRRDDWVLTPEDADTLTQRIEDFVAAVRVYVRISNIDRESKRDPIVSGPPTTATHQGTVTVDGKALGPFYGVFGPGSTGNISASNEQVWGDTKIGVRNAVLDVFDGRDVLIMGYGVSGAGKTYTLLGTRGSEHRRAVDGIAQHFLREAAARADVLSIGVCVKELYGLTPSLQPDLENALMTGAVYEYCPQSFVKRVDTSWNNMSTTSSRKRQGSDVWYQDTVCSMNVERRNTRLESTGNLTYPGPHLRDSNSHGPMLFTPRDMVDDDGQPLRPSDYSRSEPWTVVATSAPQSLSDDIIHVAERYDDVAQRQGAPVTGLSFALTVDHFKFVNIKHGDAVDNFRSIYDEVQNLRKARALREDSGILYYGGENVGDVHVDPRTKIKSLDIDLGKLFERLKHHGNDFGLRLWSDGSSNLTNKEIKHIIRYAGGTLLQSGLYRFGIDKGGDEGFMASTTPHRYILPRIFQRQVASAEYRSPAIETLRSFDHEKSTPNNPESSRGNLLLIFRIATNNGKVGYLTIADFPGVEFPDNIARGFGYQGGPLSEIRYHPPYTQRGQGAFDKWSTPSDRETKQRGETKNELTPVPLTMDEWRTVREGAFIDTMLAHLRLFLRKSSGNTSSWCSIHDVERAEMRWHGNPVFFWPGPSVQKMDISQKSGDEASWEEKKFFNMVPIYTRNDVYGRKKIAEGRGDDTEPYKPVTDVLAAPFYWSGNIWGRRMHPNKTPSVNRLIGDLRDAVSDRMLFEVAAVNRWYTWYETLDEQKRTLQPEPTRRAILLIELLEAVTTRKTLFSQDRSLHKDPKIIVMNLLRADNDDNDIRGDAVRKSVEYANSLRVDYEDDSGAPVAETKTQQVCPGNIRQHPPIAEPEKMTNVLALTMLTKLTPGKIDSSDITGRRWFRKQWYSYIARMSTTQPYTYKTQGRTYRVMRLRGNKNTILTGDPFDRTSWTSRGGLTIDGLQYNKDGNRWISVDGKHIFKPLEPRCVVLSPPLRAVLSVEEQERSAMERTVRTIMDQIASLDPQTRESIIRRFCESRSSSRK